MRTKLQTIPQATADQLGPLRALLVALPDPDVTPELDVEGFVAVSEALDRMHEVCARVGEMTLCAEVAGVPSDTIRQALDQITRAAERACTRLAVS